jgi:hypothetical protein
VWPVVATSSPQRYRTRRAVLYSVSERDNPTHIKVFEIYRNVDAYKSHLESAHFKKYKLATEKNGQSAQARPHCACDTGHESEVRR